MSDQDKVRVIFVCMGNICRSPTAHGVFRRMVEQAGLSHLIEIDSAGTHAYHVGEPPDRRAQTTALRRGIDLADLRARKAVPEDLERCDYVLAMDQDNYHSLCAICPPGLEGRIGLFLDYAPQLRMREVPDPYYGGPQGFEQVLDLVETASAGLLEHIRSRHL
jgi:low molecular weight protein-tyrosine phosphatase